MHKELASILEKFCSKHAGQSPFSTEIEGLTLLRSHYAKPPSHIISKPALCIVAQGNKWTSFGEKVFHYGAGEALVVTVEMPSVGRITEACPEKPFLGAIIEFDIAEMRAVAEEIKFRDEGRKDTKGCAVVTEIKGPLGDSVLRLVQLLDTPRALPVLAPMVKREIYYWLLDSAYGGYISEIVLGSHPASPAIDAIHYLRDHFCENISVSELATMAKLGLSAFHRRFKSLTSMTPMQYQKQLRLLEARRLIHSEGLKVQMAAFKVGYESPSQFSREYTRHFGVSPKNDFMKSHSHWVNALTTGRM